MFFFIDTNLLYSDPFLTGTYNRNILRIAKHHGGMVYLSEVVVEEIKPKIREQFSKHLKELETSVRQIRKLSNNNGAADSNVNVTVADSVRAFEHFLEELKDDGILTILPNRGTANKMTQNPR